MVAVCESNARHIHQDGHWNRGVDSFPPPMRITVDQDAESTGCPAQNEDDGACSGGVRVCRRHAQPLSMAWMTDELLARTIDVWSANYGRPISEDEAVEILMNVKRLAEVLLEARKDVN